MPGFPADTPGVFREVPLEVGALEAAQDELEAFLDGAGVPAPQRHRVRLVVEELISNLIMHGRFAAGPVPARLRVDVGPAGVAIVIEDAAAPFDPRDAAAPVAPSVADDRVGGLGLALVRRVARLRAYARLPDGRNRTELLVPSADTTAG